jgi:hypothetical protein
MHSPTELLATLSDLERNPDIDYEYCTPSFRGGRRHITPAEVVDWHKIR